MTSTAEVLEVAALLAKQGVVIDVEAFGDELAKRRAAAGPTVALHVAGLALAWACARHDPAAVAYFEREYVLQATRALRKMKLSATLADDVLGWFRFELFAREKGALILNYSGRGDLGSWVRSIAVHEALKRARRERRDVTPDDAADLPMPEAELSAMRGAYGAEFTRAMGESFASLSTEQRNLLRQYFLDGLTIDVLAGLYKVHRATAARRVAAARTELVERVRVTLRKELALSETGVDEVITLSNLKESLAQLLRKTK